MITNWIIQANPDSDDGYRVHDALAGSLELRLWKVRYWRDIAPGHNFALWVSGKRRGVYAFGVVTERAMQRPGEPDPFWKKPEVGNKPAWRIGIKIEDKLERPILGDELAADRDFARALILRMPGRGNPFPLEQAEWRAIMSHRHDGKP